MALKNIDAVEQTVNLINMFKKGIEKTKIKYANNPKYIQSSIEQAQNQITKLIKDLHALLEIPSVADVEETYSGTIILYGDQGSEAYVTLNFLKNFVKNLRNAFKAFSPDNEPIFYIRAASTGSLHLSLEPVGENKQNGIKALQEVGETVEKLCKDKLIDREKLTSFQKSVAKLLPRKSNGIQRILLKGSVLAPNTISISRGEVKNKKPREVGRKVDNILITSGRIIYLDLLKNTAKILSEVGKKDFSFTSEQKEKIIEACKSNLVTVKLKPEKGKKYLNLEHIET